MNEYLAGLIARYRERGAVVDTNLLLLFLIGSYRVDLIRRFKRTQRYFPDDFHLLRRFLSEFRQIVVTPHILTEVTNLALQLPAGSAQCLQSRRLHRDMERALSRGEGSRRPRGFRGPRTNGY